MEGNEAPEKLYYGFNEQAHLEAYCPKKTKLCQIEYTRTDAFIKKACDYLNKTCRKFILTEKDIEDFKNYMKG